MEQLLEARGTPGGPAEGPPPDRRLDEATGAAAEVRALWRRAVRRALLVPLIVMAPLTALAPTADHRWYVYLHGGLFRDNPFGIVADSVMEVPKYIPFGVFRPVGRVVVKSLDLTSFMITEYLGVPVNISIRLVSFAAAAVLSLTAVLFAESIVVPGRLRASTPSKLAAAVPFAVGAGFVAAGMMSTTVLFGGHYFLATALVLAVAAVVPRVRTVESPALRWARAAAAVLAGAALAAHSELAYFALPLATVTVLARGRLVLGQRWRQIVSGPAAKLLGWLWLGFLPVFVLTRGIIYRVCQRGDCYWHSDVVLGPDVLRVLPNRLVSWLPPSMWEVATAHGDGPWLVGLPALLAAVLLGLLAWTALQDLPRLSPVGAAPAMAVVGSSVVLLFLGSLMASLSSAVQGFERLPVGLGWRDSGIASVAGGLVLTAAAYALFAGLRYRRRWSHAMLSAAVLAFALTAAVSAAANHRFNNTASQRPALLLANEIASAVTNFDYSPGGDQRRCELLRRFAELHPGPQYVEQQGKLEWVLNLMIAQQRDRPFCQAPPAR